MKWGLRSVALLIALATAANAFSSPPHAFNNRHSSGLSHRDASLYSTPTTTGTKMSVEETAPDSPQPQLSMPLSWDEMVRQAASAMKRAASQGKTRQIARILLPREKSNADLGKFIEETSDGSSAFDDVALVPLDESWQGGVMQLYRAAAPTCEKILRTLTSNADSGLPPRITEDRSVDESGVDGVGLFETADKAVTCWLQPTQEVIDDIVDKTEDVSKEQISLLLNPQWRTVDDALDAASKGDGFLAGFASFLGGKGGTLRRLAELGYEPVYTLEGYVCRGSNVRLLQELDSDWSVFCERDSGESYVTVGTMPERPTYQDVEKMLDDSDIGYKYARDMGMAPKL